MKKVIVAVIIAIFLAGCSQMAEINEKVEADNKPEVKFLTYENAEYGVKIKYPEGWSKKETPSDYRISFISPDTYSQFSVEVLKGERFDAAILDRMAELMIEDIKNSAAGRVNFEEDVKTSIANMPARKLVYTGNFEVETLERGKQLMTLRIMKIIAVKKGAIYLLNYAGGTKAYRGNSYPKYLDIAHEMIDSFETTGGASMQVKNEGKAVETKAAQHVTAEPKGTIEYDVESEIVVSPEKEKEAVALIAELRAKKDPENPVTRKLAEIGESAIPSLIVALGDEDGFVSVGATTALTYMAVDTSDKGKQAAAKAFAAVAKTLKDGNPTARTQAAEILGIVSDKKGAQPLIGALSDSEAKVRERAAWALANLNRFSKDKDAVPALTKALNDPDEKVRKNAKWALEVINS